MDVLALPIRHIVFKLASIHVPLRMPECPLALSFVQVPLSLVVSPVNPVLEPVAVPDIIFVVHFRNLVEVSLVEV